MDDDARLLPEQPVATLEDHVAAGGGKGLERAIDVGPLDTIEEIKASGLRGRGGAGFPTGIKWGSVRQAADDGVSTPFVVANGAEGEPGTYKDRTIIELNPYAFVEGVCIAMHAVGAEQAFICIKERFSAPLARLKAAVEEAREDDWPGAVGIEVVPGPDEYLFGEEKAMLEVIEGKLPMPRVMAPYEIGLFATTTIPNPTVVNNVESLSHAAWIMAKGADWFRETGTDASPGTMAFTVVGDVANPGVYELPMGTTLRTLLEDVAGAEDVMAVYSGTSQSVITPGMLDVELCFDAMKEAGSGLGSGGFIVYDSSNCIVRVLATLSRFLSIESCGQCWACKIGTGEITGLLEKVDEGRGTGTDLEEILKRARYVTDSNRCYLPVGEQLMVGSTVEAFQRDFIDHIGRPCPSERDVPVPKIESIDHDTGEVVYDRRYHLKQPDWSYAEPTGA